MDTNNKYQVSAIPSTSLQHHTGEIMRRVGIGGEHLIVERNGFPTVVIIPVQDYKALTNDQNPKQSSHLRKSNLVKRW